MERIVVNRSATLYKTFYEGGTATDPDSPPVVAATRLSTGATVFIGGVIDEAETGTWSVTIPATSNTLLDTLTVTWNGIVNGVTQTYVDTLETVGETLFTISEARALRPLDDTANYTTAAILDMRTLVEEALEQACGVAFVPRYAKQTLSGDGMATLSVTWPRIRSIRSVTIDDTELDATALATTTGLPYGAAVYYPTGFTQGYANVIIGYEHGHDTPPLRIADAALHEARYRLVMRNSPTDDRTTTMSTDAGTFSLVVPGRGGARFFLPETNAAADEYALRASIA